MRKQTRRTCWVMDIHWNALPPKKGRWGHWSVHETTKEAYQRLRDTLRIIAHAHAEHVTDWTTAIDQDGVITAEFTAADKRWEYTLTKTVEN